MEKNYQRVKFACYMTNISMAVVGNLSPLLFLTFRQLYGISYSLLGLLVLVNFVTQLGIDLVFSFFSHKFNISKTVKLTPALTIVGLIIYALAPVLFKGLEYVGILLGTIVFSASSGLAEVLVSPVVAAIPAENPDKEMSKLHSIYAWGVVFVVLFTTVFLLIFNKESWQWLSVIFAIIPLVAYILFKTSKIPQMQTPEKVSGAITLMKDKRLWLSVFAIFLGGAAECTMAQWASGYLEAALGTNKLWGDVFGVAAFSVMLGLGRSMYAKNGKNIEKVNFYRAIAAAACYFLAAISSNPILGLLSCAATGFFVSMFWPGNLIIATDRIANTGVLLFAMMAAGGDLGASVGPQLVGVVTDFVMANAWFAEIAAGLAMSVESLGMKLGMLVGMIFPLIAIFVYHVFYKETRKKSNKEAK